MEFDKSKVYTTLNADEVKIGSKVICANTIDSLKRKVNEDSDITEVKEILKEDNERRFRTEFSGLWPLVYLVSEPEVKDWIVYLCRKKPDNYYLTACRKDVWEYVKEENSAKTKLFEGTEAEVDNWYSIRKNLTDIIAAWEDGKTIQCNSKNGWKDCIPTWDTNTQYRIKPEGLKWTDLKIGDIIQYDTKVGMVTAIDRHPDTRYHVMVADDWVSDECLASDWKKVE